MKRVDNKHRGAVLILVLGMLMIMSAIVSLFLNDVIREVVMKIQLQGKDVLRHHAYNVLDATICQIEHSLNTQKIFDCKHFTLPLAEMKLPESIHVDVQLTDESGKMPLNNASQKVLKALFRLFGDIWDAQAWTQAYWKWLSRKELESKILEKDNWDAGAKTSRAVSAKNEKESNDKKNIQGNGIKYPKGLNTYAQLREVDKLGQVFFNEAGQPNEKLERLMACTSLWNTSTVNINSASKDVLEVLSHIFCLDLDQMENYLGLSEQTHAAPRKYESLQKINELGHGHLVFQQENAKTKGKEMGSDCRTLLTVNPHTIAVKILVNEADTSFALWALLEIASQQDSLTKSKKTNSMKAGNVFEAIIKARCENFL